MGKPTIRTLMEDIDVTNWHVGDSLDHDKVAMKAAYRGPAYLPAYERDHLAHVAIWTFDRTKYNQPHPHIWIYAPSGGTGGSALMYLEEEKQVGDIVVRDLATGKMTRSYGPVTLARELARYVKREVF